MSPRGFIAFAALLCSTGQASAQDLRLTPAEIAGMAKGGAGAGTSGVSGIQTTVLSGDPSRPGPYTIEIRVPPDTSIAAHSHRDDRTAIVVAGTWYFGYGQQASGDLLKALPPGSFYSEPSGQAHFAMTKSEPARVYITGFGPTDTHYVDPAASPTR